MDRKYMYKSRGNIGKNAIEMKQTRANERARNRADQFLTHRDIDLNIEESINAENKTLNAKKNRVERLAAWKAEKQKKKLNLETKKKEPFRTIVKSEILVDTTNYIKLNKMKRQREARKNEVKTNLTKKRLTTQSNEAASEGRNLSFTITESNAEMNVDINELNNDKSQLNSTFDINSVGSSDVETATERATGNALTETNISDITPSNESLNNGESDSDNQSLKTPARMSLNTSSNYVSPFVTLSRGKHSAQKERKVRNSLYQLETSQPANLSSLERENREAAAYFRNQLDTTINQLMERVNWWLNYKTDNGYIDSVYLDQIDVAVGQTNLLISKKFNQFRNLIDKCESGETEGGKAILPADLEGFWSMIYMQVDNCNERFNKLETLKTNNWIEVGLGPVHIVQQKKNKKGATRKARKTAASTGVQQMIEAARRKMKAQQNTFDVQNSIHEIPSFTMKLRQTPARASMSSIAKTPKSIIKTPSKHRQTKSVLFIEPDAKTPKVSKQIPKTPINRHQFTVTSITSPERQDDDDERQIVLNASIVDRNKDGNLVQPSPMKRSSRRSVSAMVIG